MSLQSDATLEYARVVTVVGVRIGAVLCHTTVQRLEGCMSLLLLCEISDKYGAVIQTTHVIKMATVAVCCTAERPH